MLTYNTGENNIGLKCNLLWEYYCFYYACMYIKTCAVLHNYNVFHFFAMFVCMRIVTAVRWTERQLFLVTLAKIQETTLKFRKLEQFKVPELWFCDNVRSKLLSYLSQTCESSKFVVAFLL